MRAYPSICVRNLHVHEYQGQALLKKYGINVPVGAAAGTAEEAFTIAKDPTAGHKGKDLVVKAQVLAGGRGLGTFANGFKSGVHMVKTPEEVREVASKMLGQRLITKQTGPQGKPVNKVLVTTRYNMTRENYFAILLDRATGGPVVIASPKGGVDIETVASQDPQTIFKWRLDAYEGLKEQTAREVAKTLGFTGAHEDTASNQMLRLYDFFVKTDATLVEVNPLGVTDENELICLDAKLNFDDNAAFRQKEIFQLRDYSQEDPRDVEAAKWDLNFIGLDGNIGCLVNGAGLAMATMDIIKLKGGNPANFLDVGGNANEKQVTAAFRILHSDPNVKAILINIFGGIMRCDVIALGILNAVKELDLKIPIVVRLAGTNVTEAKKIIETSGLRVVAANDLDDAGEKAVAIASILDKAKGVNLNVRFELPI